MLGLKEVLRQRMLTRLLFALGRCRSIGRTLVSAACGGSALRLCTCILRIGIGRLGSRSTPILFGSLGRSDLERCSSPYNQQGSSPSTYSIDHALHSPAQ